MTTADVNNLLRQFKEMQRMMRLIGRPLPRRRRGLCARRIIKRE